MSAANVVDDRGSAPGLPARYRSGERLGAGASGETFAAIDVATGAACVVKVFTVGAAARATAVAEFRGLETLAHPSIVRVRDVGRLEDGRLYLVTDRVVGPGIDSLAALVDDTRRRAAFERAARDLADALAHLHGRGLVHGDICPANVRWGEIGGTSRAVLIDFGLAGPPVPGDGAARGTLGYAAPEALTGARTAAVDLFALGATLFEAFCGAAPFGRGLPAVERMLASPAPAASSIRGGLGEGWDRLFARLLAADPAHRPRSAREVLREVVRLSAGEEIPTEIDLGVPYPEGDPLEGLVVGRRAERTALRAELDRLAEGAATAAAVTLVGPPGSGRRTLFELVARDVTVAVAAGVMPPVEIWRGDVARLEAMSELGARPTASDPDPLRSREARMAGLAEGLERRARARPLCIWLEEGPETAAFAAFWSGAAPSGRVLVVIPALTVLEAPFESAIALAPLGEPEVADLVAAGVDLAPPAPAIQAIVRASQGNAALVGVLVRRLIESLRARRGDTPSIEPGADLDGLLGKGFVALPPEARALVLAAALVDTGAVEVADLDEEGTARARAAARAAGWIELGATAEVRLPSVAHRRAALAAADGTAGKRLAARALRRLGNDDPKRADALVVAGLPGEAASVLRQAAVAAAPGDPAGAALLYERAGALEPGYSPTAQERLTCVTGLALLGRYEDAARSVAAARVAATDAPARTACAERDAWLRARRGDLEGARRVLEEGLAENAGASASVLDLRARLGRLMVTMGRFREALAIVEPLFADGVAALDPSVRALSVEVAVLARAYVGEHTRARVHLELLDRLRLVGEGRRAYLAALVAQLAGEETEALAGYRRAYELSSSEGDVHTVAAVALNLGGLLAEQGIYGEALAASERAVRELGRLGAAAELAAALVNAANLFVVVGDLPAARRALGRARALVSKRQVALALAPAMFVEGDLAWRAAEPQAAAPLYRAAATAYLEGGQPHHAASALAAAAVVLGESGRAEEGRRVLAEAQALGVAAGEDVEAMRAAGVLALCDGGGEAPGALAERIDAAARRARASGRRPRAWRLGTLAARLFERAGAPAPARAALDFARTTFEEITMATPDHHRAGLAGDPDALWLAGADAPSAGEGPLAARAMAAEARLRRLLRINKRLNSELRLPRLLEMIVDTVIELTDAERGFLLLEDDSGALVVKVARNIDQRTLETAEFELSRSIAQRAAAGGEPIVTIDAVGDARFREAMSVSDLHLHSVLAVPLSIKGRIAGTIYVDHRLRKGAFGQDDVRLVLDFAEQAAIALENARLLAELRRRERQVEALNRRLEVELAARKEELSGIKQELRDNREALAVRYDYHNIIGRTPRMLELFRLLDRITDTTLPVVIAGESGTGKELVARAIHANGPRRSHPFVGENCAAIPETLLESTLFGYVRGAFTGADHDTRGLFEIADGGTLFLDEVGEMSPAMQGKLLRVLQEGELRRVGSERTRKVDVRIVAASNRDLARLVEEGKFRPDLYFRLKVAQITLPALRERRDDIPLMVEHFLARQAAAAGRPAPKLLDSGVLARLVAYRWPGNVRELENEITRADALSGERITLSDLSPAVATAGDPGALAATDPDSLLLKPRVERLERSLLREALGRAANNQTKAAELLGLSRFGLQKKLKRYSFA